MLLPHPLRSNHAEIQPLKAGGGDGCAGGTTGLEDAGDWTGTGALGDEGGGDTVVVVIVEVEVVSTVEMVLVVITVGGW